MHITTIKLEVSFTVVTLKLSMSECHFVMLWDIDTVTMTVTVTVTVTVTHRLIVDPHAET